MEIQVLLEFYYFAALLFMFCRAEEISFATKKVRWVIFGGGAAVIVGNVLLYRMLNLEIVNICLLTLTVPAGILCWLISRYKDLRFLFIFCSIDMIRSMLIFCVNSLAFLLRLEDVVTAFVKVLVMIPLIYGIYRYDGRIHRAIDKVKHKWVLLTLFALMLYAYGYFLELYPAHWLDEKHYTLIMLGYVVLIFFSYVIIWQMVVGMGRIGELQEKKTRIMVHKIQPHFIFNVLSSIRYFIKKDPQLACDMLDDFSTYLRSNIESLDGKKYIHWKEELEHINAYVRIQKMRFKERLTIVYEMEEQDFFIPPLTVEPLVENAIRHGVSKKIEGGTVWIRTRKIPNGYEVIVEDNGVGFEPKRLENEMHVGLSYVREQLSEMPGSGMRIESRPGEGTKVWIKYGVVTDEDNSCG
jgi:hypothetical protein